MTNGVFNNEDPAPAADNQEVIDPEVLRKRFNDSQAYIKQLEAEAREKEEALRQFEIEKRALEIMTEAQRKAAANPPPSKEATPASQEPAKSVDPDELVERVLKAQEQRTAKERAKANEQEAAERLVEIFGDSNNANKAVKARAAELGIGVDFLLSTAQSSPGAFYELMKLDGQKPSNSPAPRSDVNPVALKTHAPGVKDGTPEYYDQLRKDIGDAAFFTPKIQQQRFKDMQKYYAANNRT